MALPKIEKKWYTTNLLLSGKEVKFRPFTIGEQKAIMLAKESFDEQYKVYEAIIDMIQNCISDETKINIKSLLPSEFEKLFYDIKSIADGNILKFQVKCNNGDCGHSNEFELDTQNDLVLKNKKTSQLKMAIEGSEILVCFDHLTLEKMLEVERQGHKSNEQKGFASLVKGLTKVIDGEEVFTDFTNEEATKFVDDFDDVYLKKIIKYYESGPSMKNKKKFICEKCEKEVVISEGDIKNFLS